MQSASRWDVPVGVDFCMSGEAGLVVLGEGEGGGVLSRLTRRVRMRAGVSRFASRMPWWTWSPMTVTEKSWNGAGSGMAMIFLLTSSYSHLYVFFAVSKGRNNEGEKGESKLGVCKRRMAPEALAEEVPGALFHIPQDDRTLDGGS